MVQQRKQRIRREIQNKRDLLPSQKRLELSENILRRLWSLPEFAKAKTVFFFVSFRSEVDTLPMIRKALAEGKRVCVPYTYQDRREMVASQIIDIDRELALGNYDILEPLPHLVRPVPREEIDLIIMPGVAFDSSGRRLGYGGGYYDRFVESLDHHCPLVALCFELQLIEEVPCGEHDRKVDKIVTEKRVIHCDKRSVD